MSLFNKTFINLIFLIEIIYNRKICSKADLLFIKTILEDLD